MGGRVGRRRKSSYRRFFKAETLGHLLVIVDLGTSLIALVDGIVVPFQLDCLVVVIVEEVVVVVAIRACVRIFCALRF